jgi:hypothetical protein
MPVHEAAREMVRRFGARAAKVARDREDDAKSAVTARFYAQVGEAMARNAEQAASSPAAAKPTADSFVRECIARALSTLPYATLQDEDPRVAGYDTLRSIRATVERGGATAAQVRAVSDALRCEVEVHRGAGNYIKADVVESFRKQLVDNCHLWSAS